VIGVGGIGRAHGAHLQSIPGVKVHAVCDPVQESIDQAVGQFGCAHAFKDYKKLLKLKELDAVSVCTPNYFHAEPAIAALRAGKHVMVEKPMAMNARQAKAMVEAAKKARRVLVVGFQYRYTPNAQTIKRAVDDGKLGKILYARCQALRRRGIPNWGVFGQKQYQGGGPLIDIGVHILEVAHYIMGKPKPVAASAQCYTYIGDRPSRVVSVWPNWDYKTYTVEDLAVGLIRFDNGATLHIESSFAAHIAKDVFTFTMMGEKGGAWFDPPTLFTDMSGTMFDMTPAYAGSEDCWDLKMRDWIACVRNPKRKPNAPGEDGWVVQKMLDGLYRSSDLKREVKIP